MNKKSMPSPEKENSLESVVAEDIPATISKYSQQGIFIEILADGYKLEDVGICWRGYVSWNENNTWVKEDCGCYPDWIDAFNSSVEFIHNWVLYKRTLKD